MFALFLVALISSSFVLGQHNTVMPDAVKHALASSFNESANLLFVSIQTGLNTNKINFLDMLDRILNETWDLGIRLDVNNEENQSVGDYNLWFIDSYDSFRRLFPLISGHEGDYPVFYLIVLKLPTYFKFIELMETIFSDLFLVMVANVNILIETIPGEVSFYTFIPYQESNCRSTVPVLFNRFSNNSLTSHHIFPPKGDNFQGCPMRVSARNYVSFLYISRLNRGLVLKGFEAEILNELAVRMNFTIELIRGRSKMLGGHLNTTTNRTTMGSFKLLQDGNADVLLGFYLHDPVQDSMFTPSVTYFFTHLVIALHRLPYELPKLSWLFDAFDLTTWTCSLMLVFVTAVCISCAKHNEQLSRFFSLQSSRSRILNILAVTMGMSLKYLPTMNCLRLSFIVWSFGVMILRAAYQGKLFDAYCRVIVTKPPMTVKELLEKHYTLYTKMSYMPVINQMSGIGMINYKELTAFRVLANQSERNAVIGSQSHISAYFKPIELENLITEAVHSQQVCMFFQKHSIYAQRMNSIILQMDKTGLLKHWKGQFNIHQKINSMPEKVYKPGPINLSRFKYIIVTFSWLYLATCVVFVMELFWACIQRVYRRNQ